MMLIGAKVMNVYTIVHHAKCKMQQERKRAGKREARRRRRRGRSEREFKKPTTATEERA
jgi:hypothetical protein